MAHVDCPRCNGLVPIQKHIEAGIKPVCPQCWHEFAVIDWPKDTVTSEVTEMAVALSTEVDQLKAELQRWQRAFARMASDLGPRRQAEAALVVAGIDQATGDRFLRTLELLQSGSHPLGAAPRPRGDEDDEEPFTP